jgi:hypothetical protein
MPQVPNIFYPAAAPYIRNQVVHAAHMVQVTRRMDDRREAASRALAYQHALRILLNSPEGASSEYGVAEAQYLPSDALENTRALIGDAEFLATGYEAPTDDDQPVDDPADDQKGNCAVCGIPHFRPASAYNHPWTPVDEQPTGDAPQEDGSPTAEDAAAKLEAEPDEPEPSEPAEQPAKPVKVRTKR